MEKYRSVVIGMYTDVDAAGGRGRRRRRVEESEQRDYDIGTRRNWILALLGIGVVGTMGAAAEMIIECVTNLVLQELKADQKERTDSWSHNSSVEIRNGKPKQWEKTKELHQRRQEEDEEEERKVEEYREIGMRLKDYPEDEVRKARQLVSSFIKSAEEVEEKIEEAAERGELTELVLMIIWNRLDLARRDVCSCFC
ncbi:pale cress protein [Actinidia rufa]|uniref:Pale cress protein n=1 Tax=Actinidia rufa TaxID=165716 RepID=A0A7J0FK07_9ERIC|nr:pale cress protein [Actinidia rufa]